MTLGRRTSAAAALFSTLCLAAWPALGAEPDAGEPYVPRYQHPYTPTAWDPEIATLGFVLVGTGAFLGGFGLYALETERVTECSEAGCAEVHSDGRTRWGAAMLVSGIFASGVGLYVVATSNRPARIIVGQDPAKPGDWGVRVVPTEGGGLLGSAFWF